MTLLNNLFDIINGVPSGSVKLSESKDRQYSIPYIRPSNDFSNTIVGYLSEKEIEPKYVFPAQTVFVSTNGQGSHSYAYVSPFDFVPNSDVAVLLPKKDMSLKEKIFYAMCITRNRYRFSYGRKPKGDKLANINLPDTIPDWVEKIELNDDDYKKSSESYSKTKMKLSEIKYKEFIYSDLFEIKKGKRIVVSKQLENGNCPFVSSISKNNGVSDKLNIEPNQSGNTITVNYNGSIGEAFYQPDPFWASDDVNVLYPKFKLNPFIAMFLIAMIKKERYRYNYGRKWHVERMKKSIIRLSMTVDGDPDWVFMENFIKGLPYSKCLEPVNEIASISEINENASPIKKLQKTLVDF